MMDLIGAQHPVHPVNPVKFFLKRASRPTVAYLT